MCVKTINILTLGCSKNSVDTDHLLSEIQLGGFVISEDYPLDYLLINTCGFIGDAKEESINAILEAVELKKQGKVKNLAVFGCLSQRYASELKTEIPEVDAWMGARDLGEVTDYLGIKTPKSFTNRYNNSSSYAYIKISEGCDRRCSYCAIPFIRGSHKSIAIEDIVKEAKQLANKGVKELIVIAQDTTYYGLDLYGKRRLADVLKALSEIEGIEWIRIHYSYPAAFPEDVIELMASNPKICRYLDIPLQHISDTVLSNMHRGVDGLWTRELIAKMRSKVPGLVLRTTMIVGFPGENEEDFNELVSFIEDAKFERLGAFTYSEEEGTYGAEHFEDNISQEIKDNRLEILMNVQRNISLRYNESRVGTEVKVIVDDIVGDTLICRSEFESPEVDGEILVKGVSAQVGDFLIVRITQAQDYDLLAEVLVK